MKMSLTYSVLMGTTTDLSSSSIPTRAGFIDEMSCGSITFVRS